MEVRPATPNTRRRKLFKWIKIILLIYCFIGIAVYYAQDYVILRPETSSKDFKYTFDFPHKEVNIPFDKKSNINIIQFTPAQDSSKGVVLYFHGNRNNIQRYRRFVPNFTKHGYEVWMIDYPGFGKSTGTFSEQTVYDWSLVMYNLARKRFGTDSIIIYGKSLGTGVAAQLASVRDCKILVLETPYYSMTSLAGTYFWMYPLEKMMHIKLPTNEYLAKVTAPVVFFHGTDDGVIPYSNAVKLKTVMKKGDEFVTIEGGNHRNLNGFKEMQVKLDSILSKE
jgi:pimeloyl-ACP methyl ester carboxylesterase